MMRPSHNLLFAYRPAAPQGCTFWIGATAAILIVLGLLQIARIALNPSTETALVTPSYVAPDVAPSDVRELARGGEPAFAASEAPPLHPGSAPDLEVTGKVPLSTGTTASAAAAAVKPCPLWSARTSTLPCLVLRNKKVSGRLPARRTSVECLACPLSPEPISRVSCRRCPLATISGHRLLPIVVAISLDDR